MPRLPHTRALRLLLALALLTLILPRALASQDAVAEIRAFNAAYDEAIKSRDNARVLSLWAADGVSLLPGQPAMRGVEAIGQFLRNVQAQTVGWKVVAQTSACHDIEVHGTWATEWCETHQVTSRPNGEPNVESWGKMALVLRKVDGRWRIALEMWNQGPAPPGTPHSDAGEAALAIRERTSA